MLLAGDIGGTKTDLAVYSPENGPRTPLAQAEFPSQKYNSLEEIVREFLGQTNLPIDRACFDVAGPVIKGRTKTTNLPWTIDEEQLASELNFKSVRLLNDLEAIARAVPILGPNDLRTLNVGEPARNGGLAVIAPGTGLGEAFLTWHESGYSAHASEGGHADFAPTSPTQIDLLQFLRGRYDHVSFERVCSGMGIANIYDYFRARGHAESEELAARIAHAEDRTPLIVEAAQHPTDPSPVCAAALEMFVEILGAEASNLTLKVMATGGVYLGGGIPIRVLPALQRGGFLAAFKRKGRFADLLAKVPIHVITCQAAMIGAASYGLELAHP